jgi:glycosyltransferase involved in cell wall biosynthesis
MNKKVSIIVNFHNGEQYLNECINSIVNQDYDNLEIILWDNSSTDKSIDIIKKFKDSRIKYFYNKKKEPLYKARNSAILSSTGDLIAFLDCDDWWEKDYISSRVDFFSNKNFSYSYCNVNCYYEKNKKIKLYKNYLLPEGKIYNLLAKDYFIIISGVIFKKEIFLKLGMFNEKFNIIGDYDFIMKISKLYNAHAISLPLLNYRVHQNNFSKLNSEMFYKEYNDWFNENLNAQNNHNFLEYKNYFKNRLSYLEISHLLLNTKKNLLILKKILNHDIFYEKLKFIITFFTPKVIIKYLIK